MTDEHIASLIIIGDEILRGQVQDANSIYLAKSLLTKGIKIQRIVVIPDEVDVIAKEVSEASKNYPIVFTSGGVGPTHDDVTYEGVAKGLNLTLKKDEGLLKCMKNLFLEKPESSRLAVVPYPCELIYVSLQDLSDTYAVVKAKNVYVLPGSPRYFRPGVDAIVPRLTPGPALHSDALEVELSELELVRVLDAQAQRWSGRVAIGSYPQSGERPRTRLTFESTSSEDLTRAKRELGLMLRSPKLRAAGLYESRHELPHVRNAFDVLERCYDRYKDYEVFLSFNGGKDCTVVLHLVAAYVHVRKLKAPICLYVTGNAFPEIDEFVRSAAVYYELEMVYKVGPIREALGTLIEEKPELKACLLGTRKSDPHADSLEAFSPTDPGWPDIMRISPIIDWTYNDVWTFILKNEIPYCSLYDEGYTSLGASNKTTKNPLLRDPNNPSQYLPAHTLRDDSAERHGRE